MIGARLRFLAVGALAACGARQPSPPPSEAADPDPEPDRSTACGAMLDHLDAVLDAEFTTGGTVMLGDESATRASLTMHCAQLSAWNVACLALSSNRDELASCAAGNEPTLLVYGGPTEHQKAVFETCVDAATTRAALDECSYYKPGPGRVPIE